MILKELKKKKKIKDFFDRFTFKATIPLYEMAIEPNKYSHFSLDFSTRFLLSYLSFFRGLAKSLTYEAFLLAFDRIKSRYGTTKVSKDMKLVILPNKNGGYAKGYLEFEGRYKNLHFENCKYFAAIFGILGIRVTDFTYSADDYYCRLDLLATDLMFREELDQEERLKLSVENVDFIINYNRMLDERDMYLWMKLAEDNGVTISFSNQKIFNRWIKKVEENLRKFGRKEDFLFKILKFFNKLHWIRIENAKDLSFKTEQLIEKNIEQKQYLLKYLSKNAELSEVDGIYYLK